VWRWDGEVSDTVFFGVRKLSRGSIPKPHVVPVFYVYIVESRVATGRFYVGSTSDLKTRLGQHNDGVSFQTAKFRPWTLRWYCAFDSRAKAETFESYLKSGSGRAFQKRHF
jgi:putative endonuclease